MDFERDAIQTLFYDFPIELAVQILEEKNPVRKDFLHGYFSDITRWRNSAFTISEWKMLEDILNDEWLADPIDEPYSPLCRTLDVLNHVGKQVLTIDKDNKPRVQFKQLLRWRGLSYIIGEDAIVLAFLAKNDSRLLAKTPTRTSFLWGDILPHDNERLNMLFDDGVADVHNHLNATADVFHLNWISLMNSANNNFNTNYFGIYQESTYYPSSVGQIYSRRCKCVAAVFLREMLYRVFVLDDKTVTFDDYKDLTSILSDETIAESYATEVLQGAILSHRNTALHVDLGEYVFDY